MTFIVGVISFNDIASTKACVEALRKQTYPTLIGVWDNGSTDGSREWLAEQEDIVTFLSPTNELWTPAVNGIIEKLMTLCLVEPKYMGFMNNDIIVNPNTIEALVNHMENNPNIGMIAPIGPCLGGYQDPTKVFDDWYGTTLNLERMGMSIYDYIVDLEPVRVSYLLGAVVAMPVKVWKEVGPLSLDMPLGADDHDYSIRIKEAGYGLYVAVNQHVLHGGHVSAGIPEGKKSWDKWNAIGWKNFNEKWAGYYATEEEAIKCHWDGRYHPGWEVGTGWRTEEEKKDILERRKSFV